MPSTSSEVLFTLPIRSGSDLGVGKDGQIVCTQPKDNVYLLTFHSPPDNRLVSSFCHTLILALDILEHRHPPGVVITTSAIPKFYSNGMDIMHSQFTPGYMATALYAVWHRLLTYPCPTIALLNGHTFAGGAMLAMMHDYRVMNPQKGFFCLNELDLGLPLRPPMMAVFRQKIGPAALRGLVLEARRLGASDALKDGLADRLGGLQEALAFVDELKLVDKAQPGMTGKSVYGNLKREMWHDTLDLLENWAAENVRMERIDSKIQKEKGESLKRVEEWESASKSKL